MEQISRIGMDTSKHFFQLHGVNAAEKVVLRKKLRRKEMVAFFEALAPTVIGIEACGASTDFLDLFVAHSCHAVFGLLLPSCLSELWAMLSRSLVGALLQFRQQHLKLSHRRARERERA